MLGKLLIVTDKVSLQTNFELLHMYFIWQDIETLIYLYVYVTRDM